MIINKLKIGSFGCFRDKELEFKEGLNVILGPNEAGKSTAFNAIQKVLLIPVNIGKSEFKREIARFIPLGGDTIYVELSFLCGGKSLTIRRTWGGTKSAELGFQDGATITNEEEIIKQMNEILPVHPGTFKSVLMTYQSGLTKTVEELKVEYAETVHSLRDILRKAIRETDGVSVDKFKERIQEHYDSYFSHWDAEKQYPEKGRGIENPWKKEVGYILKAFYEKEEVRVSLEEAREFEEDLDEINQKIAEYLETISVRERYISENKKPVEDAKGRTTLNVELRVSDVEIERMADVNSDWPVRENKIKELEGKMPVLEENLKALEKEKQEAEIEEKNSGLRKIFKKAKLKKEALDETEEKLKSVKKIMKSDLDEIKKASNEIDKIKTTMTAGKLSFQMKAEKEFTLSIRKDLDDTFQQEITPDKPLKIEAGGMLEVGHPDWQMGIESGEGDIKKLRERYIKAEENYTELLTKHGVETEDQAKKINKAYEELEGEVRSAEKILKEVLEGESYGELESKIKEMGTEKEIRSIAEIVKELVKKENEKENFKKELREHKVVLAGYEERYTDKKQLMLNLAKVIGDKEKIQAKINNLFPLPEGIVDIGSFIEEYDKAKEDLDEKKDKLGSLQVEKAGLEGKSPEVSAEELEKQFTEAEENFRRILKKGETISKIKALTEEILGEMDSATHLALQKDLEHYISVMTGNRYEQVRMEEGLPEGFVRGDGRVLTHELLSIGTRDVLSLALRLSMANHFLKDAKGFLIMDDPLVNLDPHRQEKAVEVLKAYAEQKQMLIFTCHPSHAELLGGHRIVL